VLALCSHLAHVLHQEGSIDIVWIKARPCFQEVLNRISIKCPRVRCPIEHELCNYSAGQKVRQPTKYKHVLRYAKASEGCAQ
jgi:hypothetical protein